MTPADRKRAQRDRDRAALRALGALPLDGLTLAGLVEQIPALIRDDLRATLADVLVEIGRRGGVVVRARAGAGEPGQRIK